MNHLSLALRLAVWYALPLSGKSSRRQPPPFPPTAAR